VTGEIPSHLRSEAKARREELLDAASMFSDELMEAIFEDQVTDELIQKPSGKGLCSGSSRRCFWARPTRTSAFSLSLTA